ncbi:hypothetical protein BPS10C_047 [Bacillus phage BPS10C]|uniref:Uncharacterized protein n=1 Tax=Bacillus phage BPS10C TaxID=1277886 RepID=W5QUN2_9CAUD|nr:hypothetical protein BPS10C_047 [Bacillus phage BPS10C]AGI12044.1 hypothetical protein BPS10C_047 [Bacillus phage BPS10C]
MKKKFTCLHTTLGSDNKDVLKLKISKKGKLIIAIGEDKHTNKVKTKITQKQAQELYSGMEDVLETGRCNVIEIDDETSLDVDTVPCFDDTHYCFGIEYEEYSFDSVHLDRGDFKELSLQIRHFSVEGELL